MESETPTDEKKKWRQRTGETRDAHGRETTMETKVQWNAKHSRRRNINGDKGPVEGETRRRDNHRDKGSVEGETLTEEKQKWRERMSARRTAKEQET